MNKLLINFDLFLKFLFGQSQKHYKLVVFLSFSVFIFFAWQMSAIKQASSIEDQLDPEMQSTKDLKFERKEFGENDSIGFFIPKTIHKNDPALICKIQIEINNIIYKTPTLSGVVSPFKIRKAIQSENQLTYKRVIENPCETNQFSLLPLKDTFYSGIITDKDNSDIFYNFNLKQLDEPSTYMHFDFSSIVKLKESVEKKLGTSILWFGPLIQQYYTIEGMAHSQWINLALIIMMWIMLKLFFSTYLSGAIFISTLIFTATILYGGMSLINQPVDTLSACLFLMISVASMADFIFVAFHQQKTNATFEESHLALITPSFFTSLTTTLGFGSLMISNLSSIRIFGFWAMIGSIIEWCTVFLIIPAYMQMFPYLRSWVKPSKFISSFNFEKYFIKSPPKILTYISLLFFVYAGYAINNFRLSQTPTDMFPKDHPFQKMIEYVTKNREWIGEVRLILNPGLTETQTKRILNELAENKIVKKIETKADTLNYISQDITDKNTRNLIETEFNISNLADRFIGKTKYQRVFLYLTTSNTAKINQLRDEIKKQCPNHECFLAGQYVGFADFSYQLIKTLFDSLFLSLFLVLIIILFLTKARKVGQFIPIIISSFWGPAVLIVLIYVFDLSINFVTCIVASTLVGLTGDNAIQFIFASNSEDLNEGINERSIPAFLCSLTMAFSSLLFIFSYFEAPRLLGVLLAIGFFLAYIGDVWILKGLRSPTQKLK